MFILNSCGYFSIRMSERLVALLLMLVLACSGSVCGAASPPKMRPYSGIGVVLLHSGSDRMEPVLLYEEPGIFRRGELNGADSTGNEWIFGDQDGRIQLIATARRGNWLKVCYDDAGREAWIDAKRRVKLLSWDQFLKGRVGRLLPGLRKQYYQLYRQPDREPLSVLTAVQTFKVLRLENDWVMVMPDQNTIGWLRWRDEDGRLLLGTGSGRKQ